jgi:Orotate phosphoribosyltransferase
MLRAFYRGELKGKRVLLADDVRNTGQTFARCAELVKEAGGTVLATVEIYDRCEPNVDLGVPNIALAEYRAPENFKAADCALCAQSVPISRF